MSDASLLTFDQIACIRGGRLLFKDLDFRLAAGEAMIVTGANGVGKSSLIRLAAGLLRPAAGHVERRSGVALADENVALDPRLTLARALNFWARQDQGNAKSGMAAMSLSHLADVPVHMLSTGQKKRATLARVVASRASLWLLDEPVNGLIAKARKG